MSENIFLKFSFTKIYLVLIVKKKKLLNKVDTLEYNHKSKQQTSIASQT